MVKLQYILLIHEVQKRFVVRSISKGYTFSELRCYDTDDIVLWVSVFVRSNARLCFGSILKLYRKLIKVSSTM